MQASAHTVSCYGIFSFAPACGPGTLTLRAVGLFAVCVLGASNLSAQAAELATSTKELIVWREPIGDSNGSPTVHKGLVLIGSNNAAPRDAKLKDDRGVLFCFDQADGTFRGQITHTRLARRASDVLESGIRCRPCGDENCAYYFSNRGELVCLDLDGLRKRKDGGPAGDNESSVVPASAVIWKLDIVEKLGVFKRDANDRGNPLPSPLVAGDLVYCVTGNGSTFGYEYLFPRTEFVPKPDAPSFLAMEKKTGRVVWSSDAPGKDIQYGQWATPAHASVSGADQILFPGGDGWLYGFEALSGRLIWKVDCNDGAATKWGPRQRGTRTFFLAAPVVRDQVAYIGVNQDQETSSDVHRPVYAIDVTQKGDATKKAIKWVFDDEHFHGTFGQVALGKNVLYILGANGVLYCLDQTTGKEQWKTRLGQSSRRFSSPCVDGGKVFAAADRSVFVYADDRERQLLGRYDLDSDIEGTPAVVGNQVFVATRKYVYCLRMIN